MSPIKSFQSLCRDAPRNNVPRATLLSTKTTTSNAARPSRSCRMPAKAATSSHVATCAPKRVRMLRPKAATGRSRRLPACVSAPPTCGDPQAPPPRRSSGPRASRRPTRGHPCPSHHCITRHAAGAGGPAVQPAWGPLPGTVPTSPAPAGGAPTMSSNLDWRAKREVLSRRGHLRTLAQAPARRPRRAGARHAYLGRRLRMPPS